MKNPFSRTGVAGKLMAELEHADASDATADADGGEFEWRDGKLSLKPCSCSTSIDESVGRGLVGDGRSCPRHPNLSRLPNPDGRRAATREAIARGLVEPPKPAPTSSTTPLNAPTTSYSSLAGWNPTDGDDAA